MTVYYSIDFGGFQWGDVNFSGEGNKRPPPGVGGGGES